jgi:ribokinase
MSKETTKRKGICVVGSANVDLTFRTPRLPVPGEILAGRSLHQCMGGKGANQAVVAARLGADVTFVARVGNDAFGAEAIEAYNTEDINTSFILRDEKQPTGTAAILVDDDAENCIIVVAGVGASSWARSQRRG